MPSFSSTAIGARLWGPYTLRAYSEVTELRTVRNVRVQGPSWNHTMQPGLFKRDLFPGWLRQVPGQRRRDACCPRPPHWTVTLRSTAKTGDKKRGLMHLTISHFIFFSLGKQIESSICLPGFEFHSDALSRGSVFICFVRGPLLGPFSLEMYVLEFLEIFLSCFLDELCSSLFFFSLFLCSLLFRCWTF